ncbi:hypothetical protein OPU71_02515 [Niveibacterium sp. 24ML]|uniref:hypothetical protein n=1 Tax=Niveibacterium sp. 24ML TaxID=2985512 RepID=UPI00226F8499|nr:hypothetical protein [Niveibacterium sp. 24ML]MCX9154994.1 hypothetical protein [Niveibacterium sp. 24ML]
MLCDLAEFDPAATGFTEDVIAKMNGHIADTDGVRLPWVWITEILLSEIESNRFEHPYTWDTFRLESGKFETALFLRASHVMNHLSTAPQMRTKFDALPIKTA